MNLTLLLLLHSGSRFLQLLWTFTAQSVGPNRDGGRERNRLTLSLSEPTCRLSRKLKLHGKGGLEELGRIVMLRDRYVSQYCFDFERKAKK